MSAKVKKPMTPNGKSTIKAKDGSSSGSSKMKQASLMSFFKPAKKSEILAPKDTNLEKKPAQIGDADTKPVPQAPQVGKTVDSSPLRAKAAESEANDSIMDTSITDTPLTSETEHAINKSRMPESSPIKQRPRAENSASRNKKNVSYVESDDEEIAPVKKRRRVIESDDDDDEDDFKPPESDEEEDDNMSDFVVQENVSEPGAEAEVSDEEIEAPKKSSKKPRKVEVEPPPQETKQPTTVLSTNIGAKFMANSSYTSTISSDTKTKPIAKPAAKKSFAKENEERYQWLVNIRDAEKRPVDDPQYDPRTLYVPASAWTKFTPFEKQYWEIKAKMWDTVVFFKKGKFYELYENDAIIANSEFDLKLAGGGRANMKLAGIPEMSFDYWAKEFISHGYKVARVDQKETLLAKEMRGGSTKEEKIIKRELTGVLTGGTLTDLNMLSDDMAIYCLSIKEEVVNEDEKIFGVAFVDTATSELNLIEIRDDNECTKLDTLIAQVKPKEVLCEKKNLCPIATKILRYNSVNQIWNNLNPGTEFWDYDTTVEQLVKSKYFEAEDLDDYSHYPQVLIDFKDNYKCAFTAFGGLLYYLKSLKLDHSIMTLENIKKYDVAKNSATHLLLDGITLNNLEILNNTFDGGDKGTLFKLLNRAITPFGKRTLKHWVLHPLYKPDEINARYDSIDYLMNDGLEFREILEHGLSGIPDLERLLARIHGGTLKFKDFVRVVDSFEKIASTITKLKDFASTEMGALYALINQFPEELVDCIKEWEDSFDRQEALKDIIVPTKGIDSEFDSSMEKMDSLESQLNVYLRQYKKDFKSNEICFKDSGKEIFLIELPNKIKNIPKDWHTMGSTSKVKRYWSPEVKKLVRQLMEQRELHNMVCSNLKTRMFAKFDKHYEIWFKTVHNLAKIDCLIALTKVSETIGHPSCRPQFVESDSGFVDFKELRNPVFTGTKEFIPNDVQLGGEFAKFGLLTGANAAGKSTLMRTTALAVILSQIGCYIPAQSARLTPIDKIMTRLGANDNILQGKSTFFVELSETKKILSNATPNSLVILDELGRGGSSSDGYAIAESVLHELATHIQSLGFFATHYGTLGLSFVNHPQIKPLRMGIIVEANSRNITFLYKLEEGAASGSFGMNVAAMCGISEEIVQNAEKAAQTYERTSNLKKLKEFNRLNLGLQSDFAWLYNKQQDFLKFNPESCLRNILKMVPEEN